MRIVSYYARPASYTSGGVNESISGWLQALGDAGHEVTFAAPTHGFALSPDCYGRGAVERVPHWGRRRPTMVPRRPADILELADVVYLHEGWTASNLVVAAACRRAGVPYVVMPHGVYDPQIVATLRPAPGRHRAERRMLENAAAVHLFYDSEAEGVLRIAPGTRTAAARTGFHEPALTWNPDQARPYWAWLGRFDPHHKGIDVLLRAWSAIPRDDRPILRMVGPDYRGGREQTRRLIELADLSDRVRIEEAIPREATAAFVAASRGFVHVPRWEALGRTVVDAALLGAPVIVSASAHIASELPPTSAHVVGLDHLEIAAAVRSAGQRFDLAGAADRARTARDQFGWDRSLAAWNTRIRPLIPSQEVAR